MSNKFEECAHCGAVLPTDEWCPVVTREEDGTVAVYSFCDDDCKAAWLGEHGADA